MRDLDECTAEVFRRGEKRIRERRRSRTRVLAVCIPICLIAAAWSAMSLPAILRAGETSDHSPLGDAAGNAPASLDCPYTAVEIQEAGVFPEEYSGKVTDRLAVAELFHAVHALFADADGSGQSAGENLLPPGDTANYGPAESEGKRKDRTITFTAEDGSRAVYTLSGNILVNVNENRTIFLNDSQTAGLLAVLGILE